MEINITETKNTVRQTTIENEQALAYGLALKLAVWAVLALIVLGFVFWLIGVGIDGFMFIATVIAAGAAGLFATYEVGA